MGSLQLVYVKLLATNFLSLAINSRSIPPIFTLYGKSIKRIETVGVVVSLERKDKFLKFLIDDGTGCIPCILWLNHHLIRPSNDFDLEAEFALKEANMVQLGKLIRVRGRITVYRSLLQITVRDVTLEQDPNIEVLHWLNCIRLAKHCYDVPRMRRRSYYLLSDLYNLMNEVKNMVMDMGSEIERFKEAQMQEGC